MAGENEDVQGESEGGLARAKNYIANAAGTLWNRWLQGGAVGQGRVQLYASDGNPVTEQALNADLSTPGGTTWAERVGAYLYYWDTEGNRWLRGELINDQTDLASAARTASVTGNTFGPANARGLKAYLDITAVSGTSPTLDITLQENFRVPSTYVDMPSVAFAQKTATGRDTLTVFPGIAEVTTGTNRKYSQGLPSRLRSNSTIGGTTPSFTYSLSFTKEV